jgi:soluble lytic murein transglycosylase-like protein
VSLDNAVARVGELNVMLRLAPVATPPASAPASGFSAQLASVMAPAKTAAAGAVQPAAAGSTPFAQEIAAAAQRNGVDPALLTGLIHAESNFDPNATSSAGAQGLTQLMPGTAASLGVSNPLDPAQSIEGGARYLRQQLDRFGGDASKALAAYNAGPGAVTRAGGIPPYPETQAYVARILALAGGAAAIGGGPGGDGVALIRIPGRFV